MAEFKNFAVRCPIELVHAVEALIEKRRAERPYELVSMGAILRELLARGLESVATETAGR